MRFRVLGPLAVESERAAALGGPKQRAVLAMLIAAAGKPVSTDKIIDGVWGASPPPSVRTSLHSYVSNLRAVLGDGIERTGVAYRLEVGPDEIDAVVFERLAAEGRDLVRTNAPAAAARLREALSLWRGMPYADLPDIPGLESEIRRLEELRTAAVEARIDADLSNGRHRAVTSELQALTAEHPYHEGFRSRQMLALYRDGRQAEALAAFQAMREVLLEDLGVDPSPDLQKLEHRILTHDPDLLRASDVVVQRAAFLVVDFGVQAEMWERQAEAVREALILHDRVLTDAVEEAGGRIFRRTGDTILTAFADAGSAARAARATQERLTSEHAVPVEVRMAIDEGEVEAGGGDFYGPSLLRALRLMAAGHPGQIVLSESARDALGTEAGIQILSLGEYRFRGLGAPLPVYQLVAEGMDSQFPDLRTDAASPDTGREFGDAIRGYEIRERIGAGRFGVVYRAYQSSVGREVAIKAIRQEYANHPEFVRRFESEARLVAKLEHPHIVSLHDFWRDHEGAYFVMPHMTGGDLADIPHSEMPIERALTILGQVGSALAYAHREGVVHRDIKPANILLDADGNAYLADFGVAMPAVKRAAGLQTAGRSYRAPEERAGEAVDVRTDVYSLGGVATTLLAGAFGDEADLSGLPDDIARTLQRATAEAPESRFSSVAVFLEALRSAADVPVSSPVAAVAVRNPYKGLAAFDVTDAHDFYGRSTEIQDLVALVAERRFITVVGPSGSGKSSLVRAGLLPALAAARGASVWSSLVMTPGRRPFEALATTLNRVTTTPLADAVAALRPNEVGRSHLEAVMAAPDGGDLVLVIDQFEELYSLADDETRRDFVTALLGAVDAPGSQLRVVATIRADFFDRPLSDDLLSPRVREAHIAIGIPDGEQLLEAIVRPAEAAGLRLEPGLAARIVADVRDQPGALPLMQFVLAELVEAAADETITVDDYVQRGGVRGAIGRRADEIYQSFDPTTQAAAQQVFLRLVTVTDDADDVRGRVRLSELRGLGLGRDALAQVLAAYGSARLLTFDHDPVSRGPTVEVAHEALLREWPLLRDWITDQRESLIVRRRLTMSVDEWETAERDEDLLPTGRRLVQFEAWVDESAVPVTDLEREFVGAAAGRRDREAQARRRRRRMVLGGFAATALVAVVLALVASSSADRARSLAAVALVGDAEYRLTTGETEEAALGIAQSDAIVTSNPALVTMGDILNGHEVWGAAIGDGGVAEEYKFAAVDWDRHVAAFAGSSNTVVLLDVEDGSPLGELPLSGDGAAVAFTSGGSLVTGDDLGEFLLWDVDLQSATPIVDMGDPIVHVVVAPDDTVVVATQSSVASFAVGPEGPVRLVDYPILQIPLDEAEGTADAVQITRLALSNDGERLLTMGSPVMVASWNLATGELLDSHVLPRTQNVWSAAFSPTEDYLITGHQDRTLVVRDSKTLKPTGLPIGPIDAQQRSLSFSADGRTFITSGSSGVLVWTFSEGVLSNPVTVGSTTAMSTGEHVLSPSGSQVLAAASDRVRLYRLHLGAEPHPDGVRGDHRTLVVSDQAAWIGGIGGLYHWDRGTGDATSMDVGQAILSLTTGLEPDSVYFGTNEGQVGIAGAAGFEFLADQGDNDVLGMASTPGGEAVVSVGGDYTIVLRDPATLQPLHPPFGLLQEDPKGFKAVAFIDEETFVTVDTGGYLRVWNLLTRTQTREVPVIDNEANAVVALGGSLVAVGDESGAITIIDAASGTTVHRWGAHISAIRGMALSPDGRTLASGGQDNALRLWEVDTWSEVGEVWHSGAVRAMAFADEGQQVVAVDINGGAVVWDSDWSSWPEQLCEWLAGWDVSRSWAQVMGESRFDPACGAGRSIQASGG